MQAAAQDQPVQQPTEGYSYDVSNKGQNNSGLSSNKSKLFFVSQNFRGLMYSTVTITLAAFSDIFFVSIK